MAAGVMWISVFPLLVMLGGGSTGMPNDIVAYIDPESYFQSRQVPVTVEKMLELVNKQPTDAKGQIARLLAIRMLGEDPDEVKKEKETIVKALEPLARAQGVHGFTRVHARQTLQRLGVKVAGGPDEGPKLLDGFSWFPDKVSLVAGGVRAEPGAEVKKDNALRDFLKTSVPPQAMEEFYKFVEAVGNLRVDRLAFGYASDPQAGKGRIFFRITGAGDHKRLAEFLGKLPGTTAKAEKGPNGEPITIFNAGGFGPAMALVGDSDFVIAGSDGQGNHQEVLEQMLKVRAAGQANALKGPLADELKKVSARVISLVLGEVPAELRQGFVLGGPFQSAPDRINVQVLRGTQDGLDLRFHGKFANAAAAKAFAESMATLRKQGLEALKTPPPLPAGVKIPAQAFEMMRASLESLKMEPKDDAVAGGMQVSGELVNLMPMLMGQAAMVRTGPPMPNAPKAVPAPAK